jgi:hypothetical protein
MVETAIQAHYGVEPGNIGREYLDKLVQLPVELPTVDARALTSHFGPTGLDEIGVKILQVASADNPRLYLRIKSLWDLILPMGEALLLDMDEPMVRHLLLIAISISIRFPALREVSRSRPDGFANFASLCARPTDNSPVYLKTNAPEYLPHWEDANVRTFFSQLRQVLGDDMDPIQKAEIGRLVPILRVAP